MSTIVDMVVNSRIIDTTAFVLIAPSAHCLVPSTLTYLLAMCRNIATWIGAIGS